MVLFKFALFLICVLQLLIYIPLWSYSNKMWWVYKNCQRKIYIPLWSYSNSNDVPLATEISVFTFHYGPIQIAKYKVFLYSMSHLHSTMVLFKWIRWWCDQTINSIYIPLWSYSNKDAPKKYTSGSDLHSTMVLFKCC